MFPAEIQRVVLLIGLAATGYLLILAWNDDMQAARTTNYYSAEPVVAGKETVADISAELPPAIETVTDDDIPAMPLPSNLAPSSAPEVQSFATDRLITVTTPSVKMWIDKLGGDVVRVLLPKFPIELDDPDVPFALLDQNQQRVYVAQSGLIGADGTDSSGQRPMFSTPQSAFVLEQGELEVVLSAMVDGNPVEKIFRFRADDYLIDVEYRVTNNKTSPFVAGMFSQIKRDRLPPTLDESFSLAPPLTAHVRRRDRAQPGEQDRSSKKKNSAKGIYWGKASKVFLLRAYHDVISHKAWY